MKQSNPAPVRVAVVGAGAMGTNHARVYSSLKGAELVAVVDAVPARAASVAELYGGSPFATVADLEGQVDAASVAVPSSLHVEVGLELFKRGIDCLIEKPLAVTPEEGRLLVDAAKRFERVLLVGHIEQFNPAVEQLAAILRNGPTVLAIDARRMSAVSSRITDVDVIADLMIHDIEMVLHLVDAEVVDVTARGVVTESENSAAYVTALVTFADGTLATITASRITQNQVRELQVTTAERLYVVDYSAQELKIYRQGRLGEIPGSSAAEGQYVLDVGAERVLVRRSEPLVVELAHFLACTRGEEEPRVSGERAIRALEVAARITETARGQA